jgi:hypothetical protein
MNNPSFVVQRLGRRGVGVVPPSVVDWNIPDASSQRNRAVLHGNTLVAPRGGTSSKEPHPPIRDQPPRPLGSNLHVLGIHAVERVKDLAPILSGLAYANSRGWIKPSDRMTLEGAMWIDGSDRRENMTLAHRAVGQTKLNGRTIQDAALWNNSPSVFFPLCRPYAATDLLPSLWNALEWRLFESRSGEGFGARRAEEALLQMFLADLRPEKDPDPQMILGYAAEIKQTAIEKPLLWAMNNSPSSEAEQVFRTELEKTKETVIAPLDITKSIDAIETSAKVDAS